MGLGAGGPGMTKFVAVFEELSWLTRVLRTQLETSLCECLQQNWIKVGTSVFKWNVESRLYTLLCKTVTLL